MYRLAVSSDQSKFLRSHVSQLPWPTRGFTRANRLPIWTMVAMKLLPSEAARFETTQRDDFAAQAGIAVRRGLARRFSGHRAPPRTEGGKFRVANSPKRWIAAAS